ncbi:COX assembly mitochondrial protein homolog [Aphis gossypii]|uniref:COX assembly mitochondrial protein n=1 Tax=Aphis gossypii TaxID=80765 RepID=A0A9P0NQN0_APHGO|nr:COX assembly mitochondrial protein homolog [Aphis gossypii]CAH1736014.1 unnamed protein product [Aphis gossypii]
MSASSEIKDERKSRYGGGPHGLGDPDSYSLRKIEQNVVIPKIVRERAKYEKCSEENKVFGDCCLNTGFWMFYKCRTEVKGLNDCMSKWFTNEDFIKECRDQYLQERRQYRLTGVKKNPEVQKIKS